MPFFVAFAMQLGNHCVCDITGQIGYCVTHYISAGGFSITIGTHIRIHLLNAFVSVSIRYLQAYIVCGSQTLEV